MILVNNYPFLGQNSRQKQLEEQRKDNYSRIYTHEGSQFQSAPILIECSNDGSSSGRHVNVIIPAAYQEQGSILDIEG